MYQSVYDTAVEILGREDANCLKIFGNIAMLLALEGKLKKAAMMYLEVKEALEKQLGPDHPGTRRMKKCYDLAQEAEERDMSRFKAMIAEMVDGTVVL